MEFPIGNKLNDNPRIRYANEPWFSHVQRPSQSDSEPSFTEEDGNIAKKLALK